MSSVSILMDIEDTFAFMENRPRQRVESDASSFYFRAPSSQQQSFTRDTLIEIPLCQLHHKDHPLVFIIDSKPEESTWDDERGITTLRKYYALRDESEDVVDESECTWLDTPFSLFALQSTCLCLMIYCYALIPSFISFPSTRKSSRDAGSFRAFCSKLPTTAFRSPISSLGLHLERHLILKVEYQNNNLAGSLFYANSAGSPSQG